MVYSLFGTHINLLRRIPILRHNIFAGNVFGKHWKNYQVVDELWIWYFQPRDMGREVNYTDKVMTYVVLKCPKIRVKNKRLYGAIICSIPALFLFPLM